MNDKNNNDKPQVKDALDKALMLLEKHNALIEKGNRLAKQQYRQSKLNYEQVERQYLIEKSRLQPIFRLLVTEMLVCEADFVNDPEQAVEAKFLQEAGMEVDDRVLRLKLSAKGDAFYMRPEVVIKNSIRGDADDRIHAMSESLYFVPVDNLDISSGALSAFFLYRDKTTLPVIHKYQLVKRKLSTLLRWDAMHLDTAFVSSHKKLSRLNTAAGCAKFFDKREEN